MFFKKHWPLLCLIFNLLPPSFADTTTPRGAPGLPHYWAPALKQAVGTAYEPHSVRSPLWFTVAEGILTEVFYPTVDQAQVGDLQLLVTDGKEFFSEQRRDVHSRVRYAENGATVLISGEDHTGRYRLQQEIITDPRLPVLRIQTRFHPLRQGLKLFVLFKPAIQNTGHQNLAYASSEGLFATHAHRQPESIHAALISTLPWSAISTGYVGFSDGWQDLSKHFRLTEQWAEAGPGNIALTGELTLPLQSEIRFELALGFGPSGSKALSDAKTSLQLPFKMVRDLYDAGWNSYHEEFLLKSSPFAKFSAQVIKMHEDKKNPGAIVASLSKPAVPNSSRAENDVGGYHLVWPRDLYHAAMGLLAAGDLRTPVQVLQYLNKTQRDDGSWPQNYWVNGTPYWQGLQLDEVAFPILLAAQLQRRGVHELNEWDLEMIRRAALFIATYGPRTPQDRWEELGGYSPSTLAAEIAALEVAGRLTRIGRFSDLARQWKNSVDTWTVVPQGPHGRNYYLRASPSGNPAQMELIDIANGAGQAFASEIIDGGFLELVRLRVRNSQDPFILNTLRIYESPTLGIASPHGRLRSDTALTYRRYNRDAYGPHRVGGFWPLLAGERGHYAVMSGDLIRAQAQLFILESAALESGLLPEQVELSPHAGVASPLVWAHAEAILLRRSIEEGVVFDAPSPD